MNTESQIEVTSLAKTFVVLVVTRNDLFSYAKLPDIGAAEAYYNQVGKDTETWAAFLYDRSGKLLDHFYTGLIR